MKQVHELQRIIACFGQHNITTDETFVVYIIIDKLHASSKYVNRDLKHKKENMSIMELGNHLQIEVSF